MGRDVQANNYDAFYQGNYFELASNPAFQTAPSMNRLGSREDNPGSIITGATNATPIRITYGSGGATRLFTIADGVPVTITDVAGNTNANGTLMTISTISSTQFDLVGRTGNGAFSGNGKMDDPYVLQSLVIDGDFDIATGLTTWAGADHSIVNSLYLSAKPAFWEASEPWPSIGTDLTPMDGENPAFRRWAAYVAGGSTNKALLFNGIAGNTSGGTTQFGKTTSFGKSSL